MKLWKRLKFIWYSVSVEVFKGNLKGQLIKLVNPKRYKELERIRLSYKLLVQQKRELLDRLQNALDARGIKPLKIICRIKTIGGLDRKERYLSVMHPEKKDEHLREDFLGLTLVAKSKEDSYAILDVLRGLGEFPSLSHKKNPRDHFEEPAPSRETDISLWDRIHGNLLVEGLTPIHIRILTQDSYIEEILNRGRYKRSIKRITKEKSGS